MGLGHSAAKAETRVPISHWIWPILTSSSHSSVPKKNKKNLQNIFQPSPPAGSRSPPGLPGGLGLRARLSHRFGELHPQRAAEPAAGGRLPRGGLPDDSTTHSTTTPQHIHKKEHKEHNKQQSKNHL